jgi:hypothetical protein
MKFHGPSGCKFVLFVNVALLSQQALTWKAGRSCYIGMAHLFSKWFDFKEFTRHGHEAESVMPVMELFCLALPALASASSDINH